MKITLINPTDDELTKAVAEHVACMTDVRDEEGEYVDIECRTVYPWRELRGTLGGTRIFVPPYATSADAVLPLLDRQHHWSHKSINDGRKITAHYVQIDWKTGRAAKLQADHFCATAPTFPRAACIALLRANGVEVIT